MQTQNNLHRPPADTAKLIFPADLMALIMRARLTVIFITVLTMVSGLSFALITSKYKSQGFFQFGGAIPLALEKSKDNVKGKKEEKENENENDQLAGITLSDYKRFVAAYSTAERFNEYVQEKKLASLTGVDRLHETFASRDGISRIVEPVYPFTKFDAKELIAQPKGSNKVIGLRIEYEASSPETAQKMVGLLGRYIIDSIVYLIYSDALRFKNEEIRTKLTEIDSDIIHNKILLDEYRRRSDDLRQIITRNPAAANPGGRQVVEITEETARYLPPTTLLTTAEVQASEATEAILKAKQDQTRNQLLLEYYNRVKSELESTKSGETLLRNLEPLKNSVFKDKDMRDDVVKEVFNMITVENQNAINLYLNKSRFIAGPTLPSRSTNRWSLVFIASLALGLILSVLFVFWRNFLQNNEIFVRR